MPHLLTSFVGQLNHYSDKFAVKDHGKTITYRQLYQYVVHLAQKMDQMQLAVNATVGINLDNSLESTVAIIATLISGRTYVPLNPEFAIKKLERIVELSNLVAIVGDDQSILHSNHAKFINISEILKSAKDSTPVEYKLKKADYAYIMFTSGTTGDPKGVPITHENAIHFVQWALDFFKFSPGLKFSGHSRLSFDLSVFDLFCALSSGGCYYPLSFGEVEDPASFLRENEVDVCLAVPSIVSAMRGHKQLGLPIPSLKYLLFCGEALSVRNAKDIALCANQAKIYNIYGPTEATVACSVFHVTHEFLDKDPKDIPIGVSYPGIEFKVVDFDTFKEVETGKEGTLLILGPQLSDGYWKREDLTQKVFKYFEGKRAYDTGDIVYKDESGNLHWMARRDLQVKINGFRIELGEIEHVLSQHELINELACCVFERGELKAIQCHVTLNGELSKTLRSELLAKAKKELNSYMIPSQFFSWSELAKNANGKIDRKFLVQNFRQAKAF